MSVIVNLQAAGIRRIPDKRENKEAISLALASFLRRYPKSIRAIELEPAGAKSQNLTVQVEALNMQQALAMNAYLNQELLVESGLTSLDWQRTESAEDGNAVLEGVLRNLKLPRISPAPRKWWKVWK